MTPFVKPAELGVPGADQRRKLDALGDVRAPAVDDARDAAGLEGVDADLVEIAELARLERRREWCGEIDVALQLDLELPHIGRPTLELCRLFAQPGAGAEIVIGPDVDHPVEGTDFGVPESGERRDLCPRRERLSKAFLEGGYRARLQRVGAHLDNHKVSFVSGISGATLDPDKRVSSTLFRVAAGGRRSIA